MYAVKSMKKWQDTGSYMGADLSDWYILVSRTRDSFSLENSNYESILRDLKAKRFKAAESEDSTGGYLACNFGHWACGWIEAIMIHKDSSDSLLEWADQVRAGLDDYPVYDEEDFSEREFNMAYEYIRDYVVRDYVTDQDYDSVNSACDCQIRMQI